MKSLFLSALLLLPASAFCADAAPAPNLTAQVATLKESNDTLNRALVIVMQQRDKLASDLANVQARLQMVSEDLAKLKTDSAQKPPIEPPKK